MFDAKTGSQFLTIINSAHAVGAGAATKWFNGEERSLVSLLAWRSHHLDAFEREVQSQADARPVLQAWGHGFDKRIEEHVDAFAMARSSTAPDHVADADSPGCDPRANDICDGIQTCLQLVGFNIDNQMDATDARGPIVSNGEAAKLLRFAIASANMLATRLGADRRL